MQNCVARVGVWSIVRAMNFIQLLSELVAIPSVNPSYGGVGESGVEAYVVSYIRSLGLEPNIQEVLPGRRNVYVEVGSRELPATLIEAHMDTVGIDGWKEGSPFELREEDGRFYGRGSCDTKASLAVFLGVLTHFSKCPDTLKKRLIFAATVDEEANQSGAYELAKLFADLGVVAAISGEPTRSHLVVSHKGACRFVVTTKGKAAHASTPRLGSNAIVKASEIVGALNELAERLDGLDKREMERGTLNVGRIEGGIGFNIVPDRCVIEIDRRIGLGETLDAATQEVHEIVEGCDGAEFELVLGRPALTTGADNWFSQAMAAASGVAGKVSDYQEVGYMTNAVAYEDVGVAALVFGPGDIAQAHKIDEFIDQGEMERCFKILQCYFSS